MILNFIHKHKLRITGIVLGGVAGFMYYYFIGCANGSCMIASNPLVSVPYFAFLGYLITGIIKK